MDISYKKSGNKNYIVISDVDVKETDYRINMVMNNDIYGLLPISVRYVDGKVNLNYDITSMTSLENHYLRNKISGKELYDLVNSIYKMTQAMKEFLLDINNIWLDFEGIFIDKKTREIKFCYLPVKGSFFQENAREFFDEVLKYIDHNDKLAVLIAYNIEQITVGDNFSAKDLFDVAKENMELKKEEEHIPKIRITRDVEKREDNKTDLEKKQDEKIESKFKQLLKKLLVKIGLDTNYTTSEELFDESILEEGFNNYNASAVYEENIDESIDDNQEIYDLDKVDIEDADLDNAWKKALAQNEAISNVDISKENTEVLESEEETVLLTYSGISKPLILRNEKENILIKPLKYPCVLGKSEKSSNIVINSKSISRVHMRLIQIEDTYYAEDLNSTNGTFINNDQLSPHSPKIIDVGDTLKLADVELVVE